MEEKVKEEKKEVKMESMVAKPEASSPSLSPMRERVAVKLNKIVSAT